MRNAITSSRDRRIARVRSRFGYDRQWWGVAPWDSGHASATYWDACRRPLPTLFFLLPLILAYEVGVAWLGAESARSGADSWIRATLAWVGLRDPWWPPVAIVLGLIGWQAMDGRDWTFPPAYLAGMALESLILATGLVGLGRLVDEGFRQLEGLPTLSASAPARGIAPMLVDFLGAGLYEEALFRLALIPPLLLVMRGFGAPRVLAISLAMTASALVFSLAHHAGGPGEAFTWFAFLFRWSAGVVFAWIFLARGFGVAVGTHAAYDILVGGLGWQP